MSTSPDERDEPASILSWNKDHLGDEETTAFLVPFPGADDVLGWIDDRAIVVPDVIYFEASVDYTRDLDFPDNDVQWPILSPRLRALLLPHAPAHRVIPVTFLDDTVPPRKRFYPTGKPRPGVAHEGFAAVQLLELTDAMDLERSECKMFADMPGLARTVQKLVLKDMPLPHLFRLSAYPSPLFVSRAGRQAMQAAGIQGVDYWPLRNICLG